MHGRQKRGRKTISKRALRCAAQPPYTGVNYRHFWIKHACPLSLRDELWGVLLSLCGRLDDVEYEHVAALPVPIPERISICYKQRNDRNFVKLLYECSLLRGYYKSAKCVPALYVLDINNDRAKRSRWSPHVPLDHVWNDAWMPFPDCHLLVAPGNPLSTLLDQWVRSDLSLTSADHPDTRAAIRSRLKKRKLPAEIVDKILALIAQ